MKSKSVSTHLCKSPNKSLSGWELAIFEAKQRILALKRAIRTFQDARDTGVEFPEPSFGSESELLGQKGHLGQSQNSGYSVATVYFGAK
jgi:hypothetical protein